MKQKLALLLLCLVFVFKTQAIRRTDEVIWGV